jgi:hypothetical protein
MAWIRYQSARVFQFLDIDSADFALQFLLGRGTPAAVRFAASESGDAKPGATTPTDLAINDAFKNSRRSPATGLFMLACSYCHSPVHKESDAISAWRLADAAGAR